MALDPSGQLASAAAKAAQQQQAQAPVEPGKAGEEDVAKFEKLMDAKTEKSGGTDVVAEQQNTTQVNATNVTQPVPQTDPEQKIQPVEKPESSELVDQLSDLGEAVKAKRQEIIDRMANSEELSPQDLLEMQFQLAELTMQQTLIGKAGEKGGQAVQQLFRGQ